MPTPNADTSKMYSVTYAYIIKDNKSRRTGTIMIRAKDENHARELAREELTKREALDWYKIHAIRLEI